MTEPIKTGENSWTITLEEDPDTGELIMPLPAEALATNGWNLGDLLVWEMDKFGAIILRKSDDQDQSQP